MHYYETTHRNPGDEFATTTTHDTLEGAFEFAEAHNIRTVYEIGGSWSEFGRCTFCSEWVDLTDLDNEGICSDCRRAIAEHSAPEPKHGDRRITPSWGGFDVQEYSLTVLDGWAAVEWHTLRTFETEAEARAYMKEG